MRSLVMAALVVAGAPAAAQALLAPQMNPAPLSCDYPQISAIPTAREVGSLIASRRLVVAHALAGSGLSAFMRVTNAFRR
jgi:hypothetical protein